MKPNKKYILFDMDGTITDSKPGILRSMQYAMKSFGVEIKDGELNDYSFMLGPPLRDSVRVIKERFGINGSEEAAVAKYREYYIQKGMFENTLYPGIPELLKDLKDAGKTVILATSKVEKYARQILEHFELLKYFDFTSGAELDGRRSDKTEVILHALGHFKILSDKEKAKAVMIGDRHHDINGAAKAGIESIGVLYGYGGAEEFARADHTANNADELAGLLL
jgi:phosphoglycolate phosphatase